MLTTDDYNISLLITLLYSKSHKSPQWYIKKEKKSQEKQHFIRFGRKRMTEWKVYEFFLPFYPFTFLPFYLFTFLPFYLFNV